MPGGAHTSLRELTALRYQAHGFSYLPEQPVTSVLSGRKRSRLRGRGLDFDELRHYRPGDDIRTMDWKVTRRAGTPFVRVFTEERDRPVWVVVDQRRSMFFGSRFQMKSVAAAEAAALTAWRVLGVGDRIGAVLFDDSQCQLIPPSRSHRSLMGWLERLTRMNCALSADSEGSPQALEEALEKLSRRIGRDGLVVLISDFDGWNDPCHNLIKSMRADNDIIAAIVSDPLERDIEGAHSLVVSDGHYQLRLDDGSANASERFRADFEHRLTTLTHNLRKYGIPLIPLDTATPVASQLQRKLGGQSSSRRAAR